MDQVSTMGNDHSGRGTGKKLTKATIVVCGVAALVATLLSFVYVVSNQSKHLHRKLYGSC